MSLLSRSFYTATLKTFQRSIFKFYQKRCYSYEGDGKTTVTFLSTEAEERLLITSFNQFGFRLHNGIFILGPMVIFPRTIFSWNVADDDDISEESLSLFYHLEPKVDVLVLGLSDYDNFKKQSAYLKRFTTLRKTKLNFELLTVEKAISTFNFLCSENRFVGAALIPPKYLDLQSEDFDEHIDVNKRLTCKDDYLLGDDVSVIEKKEKELNDSLCNSKDIHTKKNIFGIRKKDDSS
ncbi:NADH dehydrogenase [ubiquinone] 1 alpha subcomplex assembly factor 3 [Lycorma delicatula]|uniref:NADH dehydrogenase [ubiquinone] 1 alpha subcomplex assembly factor 3 n=1 Tax=Lycorma delicatula TaxID=130591 RepID=UPI003F513599